MLHMPGARKMPTETDLDHLARAICETPFFGSIGKVEYFMSSTFKAKRGTEYADIRRLVVPYNPKHTDFYDVENLPRNIIEHHKEIIKMVKGEL
jgi:hypothetical protein